MRHGPVSTALARVFVVIGLVAVAVIVDYRDMIAFVALPFGMAQEQPQELAPAATSPVTFDEVSDKWGYEVMLQCDASAEEIGSEFFDKLESRGFRVRGVFGCDIPNTVVVYGDLGERAAAESIAETLGFGEVVNGSSGGSYEGEIVVYIGRDAS
ncbi:LytR C-terminal domain-containing protein [Arabiibacter massiliensis]|uniref:LytR C-terminal domain-containing protein n=1 Tax=Arabiibacter massiliensis TaxID=1870985 RepID=UPI0009BAB545|nr:LytR C-terminal domain-containing protein [Arabiibacter massiliensis]